MSNEGEKGKAKSVGKECNRASLLCTLARETTQVAKSQFPAVIPTLL
jgi:hypothetical protein